MKRRICDLPIELFTNEPKPAELAGIIADMTSDEIAELFVMLGHELHNKHGLSDRFILQSVANDLHELEENLCDGGGSRLLRLITSHLKEHA